MWPTGRASPWRGSPSRGAMRTAGAVKRSSGRRNRRTGEGCRDTSSTRSFVASRSWAPTTTELSRPTAMRPRHGVDVYNSMNLQLTTTIGGERFEVTDDWFEDGVLRLDKALPPGVQLACCVTCLFSDYSPGGHGLMGMSCHRDASGSASSSASLTTPGRGGQRPVQASWSAPAGPGEEPARSSWPPWP